MITDLIITAFVGCINALLSLIPSWSLPSNTSDNTNTFNEFVSHAKELIPFDTIVQIILLYFGLRLILASWGGIVFVYHQFWGSD